jgi:hypothetical protein
MTSHHCLLGCKVGFHYVEVNERCTFAQRKGHVLCCSNISLYTEEDQNFTNSDLSNI